jgi:AcrR family transcriptional regulator
MSASERREQLIGVARRLFADYGLDGTTVEQIALNAGVSKPVVYEHFGGKDGLYATVVKREVGRFAEFLQYSTTPEPAIDDTEEVIYALLGYIEDNPDGFRILVRDRPLGALPESHQNLLSHLVGDVDKYVADGVRAEDPDRLITSIYARMAIAVGVYSGMWWLDTKAISKRALAKHVAAFIWYGRSALDPDNPTFSRPNQ